MPHWGLADMPRLVLADMPRLVLADMPRLVLAEIPRWAKQGRIFTGNAFSTYNHMMIWVMDARPCIHHYFQ
ncbi:MAG: hypothetical protein HQ501_04115 [Rhodospirillales bacterium]|nr:hypothetical protein [Rhodospirillales bacterium]